MVKRFFKFLILAGIAVFFYVAQQNFPRDEFDKAFLTFATLAGVYFIFKVLLEDWVSTKIKDSKTRYSFRKASSFGYLVVSFILIIGIWIEDPQALLVSYGLVAAGVAIALQDFFKNIVGGLTLFTVGSFRVGDRVEIDGRKGDVIDIDLLYTTLLEIQEWVDGDQSTGRLITLPNGLILSKPVYNYNRDHDFIWDEIQVPITYGSNWQKAQEQITEIVEQSTLDMSEKAEKTLVRLRGKYYLGQRPAETSVYLTLTDNWINLRVRYIVDVKNRRVVHAELSERILESFEKTKDIDIASETMTVTVNK